MKNKKRFIVHTIIIAIAYIALTMIANAFGMAKDIVQVRISDALMVMPYFTPAAIPGLFIGCFISNILVSLLPDPMTGKLIISSAANYYIIFGSLSTLLGAIFAYLLRKSKFTVGIPAIILNSITMPLLFHFVYRYEDSIAKCFMTVAIGEIISVGLLGTALLMGLEDSKDKLFPKDDNPDVGGLKTDGPDDKTMEMIREVQEKQALSENKED